MRFTSTLAVGVAVLVSSAVALHGQTLASPDGLWQSLDVAAAAAPNWKPRAADIVSGDDVGSGANATVLKGVVLGRGCVVGAGAVVTRGEYPPDTVLAGNPARAVKTVGADLTVVTTAGVEAVQILPLPVMQSCAAETDTAPIESEAAQSAAAHALKTM